MCIIEWRTYLMCQRFHVTIQRTQIKDNRLRSDIHINHYNDVIMSVMASQITSLTIVYSSVYLGPDERKHQSSAPLAFVRGIHRGPVNSPHKGPVTLAPADCPHSHQGYLMGIINQNTVFSALDTKNAKDIFCQWIVISLPKFCLLFFSRTNFLSNSFFIVSTIYRHFP